MAASRNIVFMDPKMLNPALWRTLPKELLLLIFARLPVPDIIRLWSLSREWRRDMATVNSEINQACHQASPPMVALLSPKYAGSYISFFVKIYDIKQCRWQYAYDIHLRSPWNDESERWPQTWTIVDACDGGLVCFLSRWKPTKCNRLAIVVVNLLTRVEHELPPLHYLYFALPAMVQIKVDFDTKSYQVIVASYRGGGLTIEIYDSSTRQWTRAAPPCGSIFGPVHNWTSTDGWCHKLGTTPGAYDFAQGKLERYSKDNPSTGESVIVSVLEKERMFVLQGQMQMDASHRGMVHRVFLITEYYFENQRKDWLRWRSYECPFLEELAVDKLAMKLTMSLNACDGFLMLIMYHGQRSQCVWLLDLSTCEWSELPENYTPGLYSSGSVLCRTFWNIIP